LKGGIAHFLPDRDHFWPQLMVPQIFCLIKSFLEDLTDRWGVT
jgi:hypothetical protein